MQGQTIDQYNLTKLLRILQATKERTETGIKYYRPMPLQEKFHRARNRVRLLIGGNRSGKSVASFVEDARAVLNMDPYGKYPKQGTLALLGYDLRHVGIVMYPMLFEPGAFKVIKDRKTGRLVAFDPSDPEHLERADEAMPAPPLIPGGYIKDIAYEDKAKQEFVRVTLKTGWTILAFGSRGEPQQGFQCDVVHIDEDIQRDQWFSELMMRTVDRDGYLYWTAMPQNRTYYLRRLCEFAQGEEENGIPEEKRDVLLITLTTDSNQYLDDRVREQSKRILSALGEDEIARRIYGEFGGAGSLVYPMFDRSRHVIRLEHNPVRDNWTRYIAVDPGVRTAAAVFLAVSPDNSQWVVYDEVYLQNANAARMGEEVARKAQGQQFYAFLIDFKGSAIRDVGSGQQVAELYRQAFAKHHLRSQVTGSGFLPGSTNVQGRIQKMKDILSEQDHSLPRLRFIRERCPNVIAEFSRYTWPNRMSLHPKPDTRHVHALVCVEYLVAYNPKWQPPVRTEGENSVVAKLRRKWRKQGKGKAIYLN